MDILSFASKRYSTKSFDATKKISAENVQKIKELLQQSPSSVNTQPWHFVIASTDQGKATVARATEGGFLFNQPKILNASHVVVFCARTELTDDYLSQLLESEAEEGRFINQEVKTNWDAGRKYFINRHRFDFKDLAHWIEKQVYLNAGNFLLGVAALGIDAVPIEGFDASVLDAELGLRERGLTSVLLVPVGYHNSDDFNAELPKSRLPLDAIISEL